MEDIDIELLNKALKEENKKLLKDIKLIQAKKDSLALVQEVGHFGSWEIDLITRKSIWSDYSYEIYKINPNTETTLDTFLESIIEEDKEKAFIAMESLKNGQVKSITLRVKRADNVIITVLLNGKYIFNQEGIPIKMIGTTFDITEQLKLKEENSELASIIEHSNSHIYIVDYKSFNYLYVNKNALTQLGYTSDEMLNMTIFDINEGMQYEKILKLRDTIEEKNTLIVRTAYSKKNGDIYPVQSHIQHSYYRGKKVLIIFAIDISELVRKEKKVEEQTKMLNFHAYHNPLTHLPNRRKLEEILEELMHKSKNENNKFALLFIDLDNFKHINDTRGHQYGDEILKIISQRLLKNSKGGILFHISGDEFILLIQNIHSNLIVEHIAKQMIATLKPKIILDNYEHHITASIGISLYPKDAQNKHDLLKYADMAMYKAKEEGKDSCMFYSSEMAQKAIENATIKLDLHKAIEKNQFRVYYQPQINTKNNSIIGVEALIRWEHPTLGLLYPNSFLSIAEKTNLIYMLDYYVMEQSLKDIAYWHSIGLNPGILSLNLSIKQLGHKDFLTKLLKNIKKNSFKYAWLEFEITETQVMSDPIKSIEILQEISKLGIKISIDDFGTGYSSLAYLKRLPVDKIKIDRSFIKDLPNNDEDRAIAQAIIALAKSLNLEIIAEGVETKEQVEYLKEYDCYNIQGYYYSKPISKNDMLKYIKSINI